ncbi:hypothetical protein R1sor_010167 [Riccia sorocarpa]|uniref:Uncharacterized protein n=1 Tax=Riccia sorocarpa TaxID=122646 RepID=A0ABD3HYP0_9MARC
MHRSASASMDLEPSAPYASASSFPSPADCKNGEEPPIAYEKLQQIYGNGVSSSGSLFSKLPFPVPPSSSKDLNLDITSKLFTAPPLPQSFQPFSHPVVHPVAERPIGSYLSQNKIAYRIPNGIGTSSASTSVLQGILQKCGIGTTSTAVAFDPIKQQQQQREIDSLAHPTSWKITEKIKNLDGMLRGLEHYSAAKKFSSNSECQREADVNQRQSRIAENVEIIPIPKQQLRTARMGANKALSRSEFKAQMDKLTGVIEDRWFYGGNKRVEINDAITESSLSARTAELHPPEEQTVGANRASNNLTSTSSIHLLEKMLRRVAGLERRLSKRDGKNQKKQFKRHAIFIDHRLDK